MKILYIHGLESGPQGHKVTELRKYYGEDKVIVEPMNVSLTGLTLRNGILRRLLSVAASKLMLGAAAVAAAAYGKGWWWGGSVAVIVLLYFIINRKKLLAQSLQLSFQSCLTIQSKAIQKHQPDVVIASSFGGAVAVELLQKGEYRGPCIVLCPAHRLLMRLMNVDYTTPAISSRLLVIHGSEDKVIPHRHSIELNNANEHTTLHTIQGGSHGLGKYVASGKFIEDVERFINDQSKL
eukprot:TRINITY_DN18130_c2_g1_i1.p1 TRINITY_DN18130_c2_g1~~TRINITY_DN18130_c2_g1_i1.p1  ORF type:complete len:237 (+),score=27.87 TRINITY_DN18130_c2_g1_i1:141-851(+)